MKPLSLKIAKKLAHAKEGDCLSKTYKDSKTPLRWRCKQGHMWSTPLSGVRNANRWCPLCARARAGSTQLLTIEQMHEVAASHGGTCLSKNYTNANTPLRWRCENGHEWRAVPGSVRSGRWCGICSRKNAGLKRRTGIERYKQLAKNRGGECVSTAYTSARDPLIWKCAKEHIWQAVPSSIDRGSWCLKCANNTRSKNQMRTIEDMHSLARKRNGWFISKMYLGDQIKHRWRCKKEHEWDAVPGSIRSGSWCPECAGRRRLTINDAHAMATQKQGKCLTPNLIPGSNKLRWQCKEKHEWESSIHSIRRGSWCPTCAKVKKHSIEIANQAAANLGGKCLSKRYTSIDESLHWMCSQGHRWKASLYAIKQGRWCKACAGTEKPKIKQIQTLARQRGGTCTSRRYLDSKTPLNWRCKNGHTWSALFTSVRRGSWCPDCQLGVGERICRQFFEQILKTPFPSTRPKWLINPKTKSPLELDGYSKKLNLAFEHQGAQHYHLGTPFIKDEATLSARKALDKMKQEICRQRGVKLIEIPSVPDMLSLTELPEFLRTELEKNEIIVAKDFNWESIDLKKAYSPETKVMLGGLKELAASRNGKCLSRIYLGSTRKHEWECLEGHRWQATPVKIKSGRWCRRCAGREPRTIEEMRDYAISKGGQCLSNQYLGGKTKLHWECKKGHQWWALPSNLNKGTWCSKCYHLERSQKAPDRTIEDIRTYARSKGGNCLSKKYWRATDKLEWVCKKKHKWFATASSVLRGSWCKKCSTEKTTGVQRLDISKLRQIAINRGGKLIGGVYRNTSSKMRWQCSGLHQWRTSAASVLSGSWCPICARKIRSDKSRTSIEEIQKLAVSHGGACLSKSYNGSKQKITWRCREKHTWNAALASVKGGTWCPECAKKTMGAYKRLNLDNLIDAARKRGGTCLSKEYLGSQEKHLWKCSKGHQWEAVATAITSGHSWCPECAPNKKRTIEDMRLRAIAVGGRCLSQKYINAHVALEWECAEGHRWLATPDSVQQGYWCKICKLPSLKPSG